MRTTSEILDEIISKKEDISRAIAMSYADGDKEKAEYYFSLFNQDIQESKVFIFKEPTETKYQQSIAKLYTEISNQLGHDVRIHFFDKPVEYDFNPLEANTVGIDEIRAKKLKKMYSYISKSLLRANITYQDYINMYNKNGLSYIKNLSLSFLNLQEKLEFKSLKTMITDYFYKLKIDRVTSGLKVLVEQYELKSVDDIMKLHTEVSSFFVDMENLSDEEKAVYQANMDNFRKRPYCEKVARDKVALKNVLDLLEKIYSNEFMKECLDNSNIQQFFDRYGFTFNSKNLKKMINDYFFIFNCEAYVYSTKMDGIKYTPVFFREESFRENYNKNLNNTILHEFIHVTEKRKYGAAIYKNLGVKCTALNEAMTDYLAAEALKYLKEDVVTLEEERYRSKSSYRHMLPLVDILKDSVLWEDLLKAKLDNDYSIIENKIGYARATKMGALFTKVFKKTTKKRNFNIQSEYKALENMVKQIEREQKFKNNNQILYGI